jgi:hypothetical protein
MPGKRDQLTPLESRKQLLILESELNRTHLLREIQEVKTEVRAATEKLRSASVIARLAADALSSLAGGGANDTAPEKKPAGKFFGLGNLARLTAGIWKVFRAHKD